MGSGVVGDCVKNVCLVMNLIYTADRFSSLSSLSSLSLKDSGGETRTKNSNYLLSHSNLQPER